MKRQNLFVFKSISFFFPVEIFNIFDNSNAHWWTTHGQPERTHECLLKTIEIDAGVYFGNFVVLKLTILHSFYTLHKSSESWQPNKNPFYHATSLQRGAGNFTGRRFTGIFHRCESLPTRKFTWKKPMFTVTKVHRTNIFWQASCLMPRLGNFRIR